MASTGLLVACSSLPGTDYGDPPPECAPLLVPGTRLEWAGRGDHASLGFPVSGGGEAPTEEGDVYVGRTDASQGIPGLIDGQRVFCIVYAEGLNAGPVPEGWRPP